MAAALVALLAYSFLQIALYGALGPSAASQAAAHLGVHAPWWAWALGAWAVITVLGLLRVDITGRVLGALTAIEIVVILAETVTGLAHPAGGHLSFATLSPSALTSARVRHLRGAGRDRGARLLRVRAGPGARRGSPAPAADHPGHHLHRAGPDRRGVCRVGVGDGRACRRLPVSWLPRTPRVPALMFGLGGSVLSQAAQWLFLTSLFAAALAFHNAVWRYAFALGREGVLPGWFGRTGSNNIPKAASLAQSVTGLVVIGAFAVAGWPPMTGLFFGGGTTGGFGILILLARDVGGGDRVLRPATRAARPRGAG